MNRFSQEIEGLNVGELEIKLREVYQTMDSALPSERPVHAARVESIVAKIHDLKPIVKEMSIEDEIKALRAAGREDAADNLQAALDQVEGRE